MKPPAKHAKRGRALEAQEEWLWREAMRDVAAFRPLPALPPQKRSENPSAPTPKKIVQAPTPQRAAPAARGHQILGTGVDGRTAKRLAQGRIAPEATLDLHGMTQDHAHAAMERFLSVSVAHGRRCVLIVTGKGGPNVKRDGGDAPWAWRGPGVLKALVPVWLEHSLQRDRIAAIRNAHAAHGGGGALYIYLRGK
jgi:DNA-nicking Smr family endonuclease